MGRRVKVGDPDTLRIELISLLNNFEQQLKGSDLREQVRSLIPAVYLLRDLGSSLIPKQEASSARERILYYFQEYPYTVIPGDELAVVSGISEYARRVRELRVEFGWPIYSGNTAKEMLEEEMTEDLDEAFSSELSPTVIREMNSDDYILAGEQDRDAAHRWNLANDVRKLKTSIRNRLLKYLRKNVGQPVTGEELKYIARGAQSWPRRTRELRTEEGWPVVTKNSGRPELSIGLYLLEADRQSAPHDRHIPDSIRVKVLERDNFRCQCCGWSSTEQKKEDPRTLIELHHIEHHSEGGSNNIENLITLCNVHHDQVHKRNLNGEKEFSSWLEEKCSQ
jgi:hypothetical protein